MSKLGVHLGLESPPALGSTFPSPTDLVDRCFGGRHFCISQEILIGIVQVFDFCVIVGASEASFAFYFGHSAYLPTENERYFLSSLLAAGLFLGGFRRIGGYSLKQLSTLRWQLTRAPAVWAIAISILLLIAFLCKLSATYARGWTIVWTATTLMLLLTSRCVVRFGIPRWVRDGFVTRKLCIVGAGRGAERLIAKLQKSPDIGVAVVGIFDDGGTQVPSAVCGFRVLGTTDDLIQWFRYHQVDDVIVALPLAAEQSLKATIDKLRRLPVDLHVSAEPLASVFPIRRINHIGGVPLLGIVDRPVKNWGAVAKWMEDKILSIGLLLLIAPLMALIAILIKLDSRGPVFFRQERFGFNNEVIRVLKFRTMQAGRGDVSGARRTLRNDPRVTRIGRILRALSLDELPQLINVATGEMSLVGPRAHPVMMMAGDHLYHDAFEQYAHRHRVKPGITGWAQVNGSRGEIDTVEKAHTRLEYDLFYVQNWALWLDLKILVLTVPAVLSRKNAY